MSSQLPTLRRGDGDAFRRALVGLIDPSLKMDKSSTTAIREEVVRFVGCLPEIVTIGERTAMWSTIVKGLHVAGAAHATDDFAAWSSAVVEQLTDEPWRAAMCETFATFQAHALAMPEEWREDFIRHATRCLPAVVALARVAWVTAHPRKDVSE